MLSLRDQEATDRIAAAVSDLRKLHPNELAATLALRKAIERGGFVLVLAPDREVYWEGKRIDANWGGSDQLWMLFKMLAFHALSKRGVDREDIYETAVVTDGAFYRLVARLKKRLPKSLRKYVKNQPMAYTPSNWNRIGFTSPTENASSQVR